MNEKSKFHQQLHHKHELEHLYNIYVEIKHYNSLTYLLYWQKNQLYTYCKQIQIIFNLLWYIYADNLNCAIITDIVKAYTSESWYTTSITVSWAQLTKIYPPLPTSVQPISITKTLLIVQTKNERDPPLFTSKQLIRF